MKAFNIFQWYQSAGDRRFSSIKFAFKIRVFAHELWNCEWTQCPDQRWWLSNGSLLPRSESIHHHQNLLPTGSRLGVVFLGRNKISLTDQMFKRLVKSAVSCIKSAFSCKWFSEMSKLFPVSQASSSHRWMMHPDANRQSACFEIFLHGRAKLTK